jgi:hypothetical protein
MAAYAECVWGLWTETNEKYLNRQDPKYLMNKDPEWSFDRNVYDTRVACESALSQQMSRVVKTYGRGRETISTAWVGTELFRQTLGAQGCNTAGEGSSTSSMSMPASPTPWTRVG